MQAGRRLWPPTGCLAIAGLLAFVSGLWLRFNAAGGATGSTFPRDFLHYQLPMTELAFQRIRFGELPLWNPYVCSGIPLLATLQVAVFYPLNWLALLFPAETALPFRMFFEVVLAGCFATALFRTWGHGWAAALAGGALYIFACVLGLVFWPPMLSTAVWLPALLLCVEQLLQRWRWSWWVGLSLCVALQCLAGFPQLVVYSFYLVAPYAFLRLVGRWSREEARRREAALCALGLLLAVLIGVGLACLQLLPALELVAETQRNAHLTAAQIHHEFTARPLSVLGVLHNALDPRPKMITPGYGTGGGYFGIATLILLVIGLAAAARQPLTWLFAAVGSGALLLSGGHLGWASGLFELYAKLPTGSLFRDPQRMQFLAFFCVIALAIPGFDQFARGFVELRERPGARACALGLAIGISAVIALQRSALAIGLALATWALLFGAVCWGADRRARFILSGLMLAILAGDLYHATEPNRGSFRAVPTARSANLFRSGQVIVDAERYARIREEAGYDRVAFPDLKPALGLEPVRGAYRVQCREALVPSQWSELHFLIAGKPPVSDHVLYQLPSRAARSFFDVASVRMIGVLRSDDALKKRAERSRRADAGRQHTDGVAAAGEQRL